MSQPDQNTPSVRTPPRALSPGVIIVTLSLILGFGVLVALLTIRNTKDNTPTLSNVRLLSNEKIQTWIQTSMKNSNSKVGVVNIWATWCEPCRQEMPELAKFQATGTAPLFLISADNEVDLPIVQSFLKEAGATFESALIAGDQQVFIETWQKLSHRDPARQWSMSLPVTFLVNASGQVISFRGGTTTATELQNLVKTALDTARD